MRVFWDVRAFCGVNDCFDKRTILVLYVFIIRTTCYSAASFPVTCVINANVMNWFLAASLFQKTTPSHPEYSIVCARVELGVANLSESVYVERDEAFPAREQCT